MRDNNRATDKCICDIIIFLLCTLADDAQQKRRHGKDYGHGGGETMNETDHGRRVVVEAAAAAAATSIAVGRLPVVVVVVVVLRPSRSAAVCDRMCVCVCA